MIVETGDPEFTGTYAVYLKGDKACYAARFWLIGTGWLTNLKEPLPDGAEIDGWIGPIPLRKLPPATSKPVEYNTPPPVREDWEDEEFVPAAKEYDL